MTLSSTRERRKRPHDLEGAADAAPADLIGRKTIDAFAGESDGAAVGREHTGDHVEKRRLAGAVRPDHRKNLAFRHFETDAVDRDKAAETLADAVDCQERAHCFALRQADTPRKPRPDPVRQRNDHQQQHNAEKHLLGARQIDAEPCQQGSQPFRHRFEQKAPRIGPNSVPTPPTIGPRMISIDCEMLNTCSGNRLL